MTLDKAIEILEDMRHYAKDRDLADDSEATKLGIEALKLLRDMRINPDFDYTIPLEGETKE